MCADLLNLMTLPDGAFLFLRFRVPVQSGSADELELVGNVNEQDVHIIVTVGLRDSKLRFIKNARTHKRICRGQQLHQREGDCDAGHRRHRSWLHERGRQRCGNLRRPKEGHLQILQGRGSQAVSAPNAPAINSTGSERRHKPVQPHQQSACKR